eukprot:8486306-Pyramimonas_sp.AAC.1
MARLEVHLRRIRHSGPIALARHLPQGIAINVRNPARAPRPFGRALIATGLRLDQLDRAPRLVRGCASRR